MDGVGGVLVDFVPAKSVVMGGAVENIASRKARLEVAAAGM